MSREIKFRAWDNTKEEWTLNIMECVSSRTGNIWMEPALKYHKVVIEQFTGLKDKNGKEIYEGDIVKIVSETWLDPDVGTVGFDEDRGVYDSYVIENDKVYWDTGGDFCSLMGRENFTTEVIGNVHENPELLGGEE